MTQDSRILGYKQHMAARGVGGATAFPPLWHLLWASGIKVPPPPFLGFVALTALAGGVFGPLFALSTWWLRSRSLEFMSAQDVLWLALGTGLAFGLAMAAYYRHLARRHGLGSWEAFRPSTLPPRS